MSGEREGDREAMHRTTKRLIDGGMDKKKAREMARKAMIDTDRNLRKQGQR